MESLADVKVKTAKDILDELTELIKTCTNPDPVKEWFEPVNTENDDNTEINS